MTPESQPAAPYAGTPPDPSDPLSRKGISLREQINAFLYFGYVPETIWRGWELPFDQALIESGICEYEGKSFGELVDTGAEIFLSLFNQPDVQDREHVVPLSGGMDSRMVLGGLLRKVGKDHLTTTTFGVPGMLDVTIAQKVGEACGATHRFLDTRLLDFSIQRFEREIDNGQHWLPRIKNASALVYEHFGADKTYWSGYLGDIISRGIGRESAPPVEEARKRFINKARTTKPALCEPSFDPERWIPASLPASPEVVPAYDQINLGIRQRYLIAPSQLPPGHHCETPYGNREWLRFMLGVPGSMRRDQRLFRAIGRRLFPELMALPIKRSYGLPMDAPAWKKKLASAGLRTSRVLKRLSGRYPGPPHTTNQMDWPHELRHHAELRALLENLLPSLEARGVLPWLDIGRYWREHQAGRRDHSSELLLLGSLELSLRHEPGADQLCARSS